jgi:hypothetical protein
MASNKGTRRWIALLLVVATIATVGGFVVLLTESTGAGGVLLATGAICSGVALLEMRRER